VVVDNYDFDNCLTRMVFIKNDERKIILYPLKDKKQFIKN
jgi:hypothetical protein